MIYEKLLIQADNLKSERRFEEAIVLYNQALETGANEAECYYDIARCLALLKKYDEAIMYFKKVHIIEPENENAMLLLAKTYYMVEQDNAALLIFKKLLDKYPDFSEAHYFIGIIEKDLNISIEHLEKALHGQLNEKQENDAKVTLQRNLILLAIDLMVNKKSEQARIFVDKAIKLGQIEENQIIYNELLSLMRKTTI